MTGVLTGKEEEGADNTRMEGWRGDHMRTQGEGGRLQAPERGLRRNLLTLWSWTSRTFRTKSLLLKTPQSLGFCCGSPSRVMHSHIPSSYVPIHLAPSRSLLRGHSARFPDYPLYNCSSTPLCFTPISSLFCFIVLCSTYHYPETHVFAYFYCHHPPLHTYIWT